MTEPSASNLVAMDEPLILAIDQGTTSTRAIVFDRAGQRQAVAQVPLKQIYPRDGWVEHDPEEIWQTVLSVCRAVLAEVGGSGRIAGLGITNQRETTVIWNRKTGACLGNAIVWQDRRGADACRSLVSDGHGDVIQAKTGLIPDSYFSATKLQWLLNQHDPDRSAARNGDLAFGTIDSFLLWRLTGGTVHATDATNASRTMLFNIADNRWDEELLNLFAIPSEILPEVRDTAGPFGTTAAEIFGKAIPVGALVGDQQSALIGQACIAPGMVKSTFGTGAFVLLNIGAQPVTSTHRLLTTIAYRLNGATTYALEGSVFNAGTVVQWLRDETGFISHAAETADMAASVDSSHGVVFVPAFTGLGAPHWDPDARGAIIGLTRNVTAAHIVRAGLEAVCFQTADLLNAMAGDGAVKPDVVRADGGMADNDWLMQELADATDMIVERPKDTETTVLGAALLAGLSAGLYNSLEDAAHIWSTDRQFTAQRNADERKRRLADWHMAVSRVRSG